MLTLDKQTILKTFPLDSKCRVRYKDRKDQVEYSNMNHVNWNNVLKITIIFKEPKKFNIDGDCCVRDGVSILLK